MERYNLMKVGERWGGGGGGGGVRGGKIPRARLSERGPDFSKSSDNLCDEQNHPRTHDLCHKLSKKSCRKWQEIQSERLKISECLVSESEICSYSPPWGTETQSQNQRLKTKPKNFQDIYGAYTGPGRVHLVLGPVTRLRRPRV